MYIYIYIYTATSCQQLLRNPGVVSQASITNPPIRKILLRTTCRITAGTVPTGLRKEPSGFPGSTWTDMTEQRKAQASDVF